MTTKITTQVGIVGAGPAGLMLSHLLHLSGIESIVVEIRSREYCEMRVRAGVLEHGSVQMLREAGVDARLNREGLRHEGIELGMNRKRYRIPLCELTDGKAVTVYGQHEVVKDLIAQRLSDGGWINFDCSDVSIHRLEGPDPYVRFRHDGQDIELNCDYLAGCDGFHGVCRSSIPKGILTSFDRAYPFGWLGILAQAAPSLHELVYMHHEHGFALYSMRSLSVTRLYLQCQPDEDISLWSDDHIWAELFARLGCNDGWQPTEGKILQKSVTSMRSHVTEPMQYGRLFLAGDAVHIVPPTGAKGMNLAFADIYVLAQALSAHYERNSDIELSRYSEICLRRVWNAQRFSSWMTSLFHRVEGASPFDQRRQLAELDYLTSSRTAAASLAENYVGLPLVTMTEGMI